jgi:hypothetical protein
VDGTAISALLFATLGHNLKKEDVAKIKGGQFGSGLPNAEDFVGVYYRKLENAWTRQ